MSAPGGRRGPSACGRVVPILPLLPRGLLPWVSPPHLIRTPGFGLRAVLLQGDLILTDYTCNNPISKWGHVLRFQGDTPRKTLFSPSQGPCWPSRPQFTWVLIFRPTSQAGELTPELLRVPSSSLAHIHTPPTVSTAPQGMGKFRRLVQDPLSRCPSAHLHHSEGQGPLSSPDSGRCQEP